MGMQDSGPRVKPDGESLVVGRNMFRLAHRIKDAFLVADRVIVLFDGGSVMKQWGQFANLVAIEPTTGEQLWEAELPTTTTGDLYYKIASHDPLVAYSVKSFACTIDTNTGAITEKEFFK